LAEIDDGVARVWLVDRQGELRASEAAKRGVVLEDGNVIVPPTRQYKDAEIRQLVTERGVDGVLVVTVTGDTGVQGTVRRDDIW
jgi:hypothetical protein